MVGELIRELPPRINPVGETVDHATASAHVLKYAAGELGYVIPERVGFPGVDLRLIRGETELLPGVRVIFTPGHTPGHQSLVIDEREGPVILAGQAAYTAAEFVEPERDLARGLKTAYDQHQFLKSLAHLQALKPQRVYFSHAKRVLEPPNRLV